MGDKNAGGLITDSKGDFPVKRRLLSLSSIGGHDEGRTGDSHQEAGAVHQVRSAYQDAAEDCAVRLRLVAIRKERS